MNHKLLSHIENIALATMSTLVLSWCVISLWFPFGWDQGIMASVGDAIVRGGLPYRDGWDSKGPLVYYIFAIAEWALGRHMWAIRVFDLSLLLLGAAALARMMARITSPRAGLWCSLGMVCSFASLTWFHVSQPDGWVALLMVISVTPLIIQRERVPLISYAWCSLLIGVCALIKPFYGAFLGVPLAFVVAGPQGFRQKLKTMLILGLAVTPPLLLALGWFAYQGALDSLIEVHVLYNGRTYSGIQSLDLVTVAKEVLDYLWTGGSRIPAGKVTVLLPAIAFGSYAAYRKSKQLGAALVAWLVIAMLCVTIQGKFFVYHWIPTFPPFVMLAGVGLWTLGRTEPGRIFAGFAAFAFLALVAVTPAKDVIRSVLVLSGRRSQVQLDETYARGSYVIADVVSAADYIRERTTDSETVAVFGNESTINFVSGRPSPTRFVFGMPVTRPGFLRSRYRQEYVRGMITKRPTYVVVGNPHEPIDKEVAVREFPEFADFLKDHYSLERHVGQLDLYRLAN